jgi:hypothetical protein
MSAHHHISSQQLDSVKLAELADDMNNPDIGGFSVKAFGPRAGDTPPPGFMVGRREHGMNGIPMPVEGSTIGEFAQRRRAPLSEERNYLGGWEGKGEGGSLDVTTHTDASLGGLVRALKLGKDEDAIGTVGPGGKAGIGSAYSKEKPAYSGEFPRSLIKG